MTRKKNKNQGHGKNPMAFFVGVIVCCEDESG